MCYRESSGVDGVLNWNFDLKIYHLRQEHALSVYPVWLD